MTGPTAMAPASTSPAWARRAGWLLAAAILAFGLYTEDWQSVPWAVLAVVLYGLPLALQAARRASWRAWGLWGGLFLVAQTVMTPLLRGDYQALPPNMKTTVQMLTDGVPGMPRGTRQVTTDENGWRVQPRIDYARKQGTRVFAIGGSTTEDILLDDRSTWTHLLQQRLAASSPGLHVVNTGVSGLRAANHVATLERVAGLQPDLVVVLLGGNDWNRHIKAHFEPDAARETSRLPPLRRTALLRVLDSLVVAPLRMKLTGRTWGDTTMTVREPQDLNGDRTRHSARSPRHRWVPEAVSAGYAADLERLAAQCRERKLRCLFATQPAAYGGGAPAALVSRFWMTPPYASYGLELESMHAVARLYNAHLLAFATRHGLASCDLAAAMPADGELFYDDMHYTDAGARRVAEVMSACAQRVLAAPGS